MVGSPALTNMERSAYRSTLEDGIAEILMSSFFICTAISTWDQRWAWLYVVPFFFVLPASKRLKKRFTYPRIGYVEPESETPGELFGGIVRYVVIVLAIGAIALFLFGDIGDPAHWYRWSPVLTAVMFCGGFHYAGTRSGLVRFHMYTVVAIALALLVAILDPPGKFVGLSLFLATMGTITAATGLIVFRKFVREHPVASPVDPATDAEAARADSIDQGHHGHDDARA